MTYLEPPISLHLGVTGPRWALMKRLAATVGQSISQPPFPTLQGLAGHTEHIEGEASGSLQPVRDKSLLGGINVLKEHRAPGSELWLERVLRAAVQTSRSMCVHPEGASDTVHAARMSVCVCVHVWGGGCGCAQVYMQRLRWHPVGLNTDVYTGLICQCR